MTGTVWGEAAMFAIEPAATLNTLPASHPQQPTRDQVTNGRAGRVSTE